MDVEKRLVAGLLGGFKATADQEKWVARLKAVLLEQPTFVGEPGDVGEPEWAAWQELKSSVEGKSLLNRARYRIALKDMRESASWAAWLPYQQELCGGGWFIEVSSPVKVIDWKWPLTMAVVGERGYGEANKALEHQIKNGPDWMKVLVRRVQTPPEEVGVADILIFPQGPAARETLLGAGAPVTADLLVLCGIQRDQFGEVAAGAEELLRLTQANAVLAANVDSCDATLLQGIIAELAHDYPLDLAVAHALRHKSCDPGLVLLLSTAHFIEKARLSTFVERLTARLRQIPDHTLDLKSKLHWVHLPDQMLAKDALQILEGGINFYSERMGASVVSTVASSVPPLEPPAEPKRQRKPGVESEPRRGPRFLMERVLALEPTRIPPEEALEATKRYMLEVHIGHKQAGYYAGKVSLPEPPVRPEESAVILLVVFFEKNSKPDAESRTIRIPRIGESSRCEFEFTASDRAKVFEGWLSVYHNNRLLQEGVLRARVDGGAGELDQVPKRTVFNIRSRPRPLELGLESRALYGGTIRLDGGGTATGVRGLQAARVNLPGLKYAVESLERVFNRMPWEDLAAEWVKDDRASERLSIIAQQGWQLHEALRANPLIKRMEESGRPLVVYAADANVRAPLELCYSKAQPKSTAKVCQRAAEAVAQGSCPKDCEGQKEPRNYVCPMGFWGLSKVIEWRSQEADSRDNPAMIEVTNEPVPGRRSLKPLASVLVARSGRVTETSMQRLETVLRQNASSWREVKSWEDWEAAVGAERPTLLVLMAHVDNSERPPLLEVQTQKKDPPGIDVSDVVGYPPQQPMVLLLGCGAATSLVDFMSLPAQFRRRHAAVVVASFAEVLAEQAPEMARSVIEVLSDCSREPQGTRLLGEVLLSAKRKLVADGKLAGILLLAFGDADWLV